MRKISLILVAIAVLAIIFFALKYSTKLEGQAQKIEPMALPEFSLPSLDLVPETNSLVAVEAWSTFQKYLEFAKNHDLEGVKSLSYQMSETCLDPKREEECFKIMDNVYNISTFLSLDQFKHTRSDGRQAIMYTDPPGVTIIYFVRSDTGDLKVLGLSLCIEDEMSQERCVEPDPKKRDRDNNGWWDMVEKKFYQTQQPAV